MKKILLISIATAVLASCSTRLIDFTVISTKTTNAGFDKSNGKEALGKSIKIFGIGASIEDAIDNALENAGVEYDLLIDGVLTYHSYVFANGYKAKGVAINSKQLKADLGEEKYKEWYNSVNIMSADSEVIFAVE